MPCCALKYRDVGLSNRIAKTFESCYKKKRGGPDQSLVSAHRRRRERRWWISSSHPHRRRLPHHACGEPYDPSSSFAIQTRSASSSSECPRSCCPWHRICPPHRHPCSQGVVQHLDQPPSCDQMVSFCHLEKSVSKGSKQERKRSIVPITLHTSDVMDSVNSAL